MDESKIPGVLDKRRESADAISIQENDMHDDHEEMVDREIARQAELMAGLTREDAEIMAHDRLNPGFGLTLAAEASLLTDRRDAKKMTALLREYSRWYYYGSSPQHYYEADRRLRMAGLPGFL